MVSTPLTTPESKFVFSTKALTLQHIAPLIHESRVPTLIYFTVGNWNDKKDDIILKIKKTFHSTIVVRSSALNEDTASNSMAGLYESILDIDSQSETEIENAVTRVIGSYKKGSYDNNNQILVQQQITDVQMSGVVFTRDLETGAPYYIINFDDYSGRTDIITSGTGDQQKIFTYCKLYNQLPTDPFLAKLIIAIRELENVTENDSLDIEFVIANNIVYTIQVRPLAAEKKKRRPKISTPYPSQYMELRKKNSTKETYETAI